MSSLWYSQPWPWAMMLKGNSQISDASLADLYTFQSCINERWTMHASLRPDTEWVIEAPAGSYGDQSRIARKASSLDGGRASAASYLRSASPANEAQQTRSHLSVNGTPFGKRTLACPGVYFHSGSEISPWTPKIRPESPWAILQR